MGWDSIGQTGHLQCACVSWRNCAGFTKGGTDVASSHPAKVLHGIRGRLWPQQTHTQPEPICRATPKPNLAPLHHPCVVARSAAEARRQGQVPWLHHLLGAVPTAPCDGPLAKPLCPSPVGGFDSEKGHSLPVFQLPPSGLARLDLPHRIGAWEKDECGAVCVLASRSRVLAKLARVDCAQETKGTPTGNGWVFTYGY